MLFEIFLVKINLILLRRLSLRYMQYKLNKRDEVQYIGYMRKKATIVTNLFIRGIALTKVWTDFVYIQC